MNCGDEAGASSGHLDWRFSQVALVKKSKKVLFHAFLLLLYKVMWVIVKFPSMIEGCRFHGCLFNDCLVLRTKSFVCMFYAT